MMKTMKINNLSTNQLEEEENNMKNERKILNKCFPNIYRETLQLGHPLWTAVATVIQNKKYGRLDGDHTLSENIKIFTRDWIFQALENLEIELKNGYVLGDYAIPRKNIVKFLNERYEIKLQV